jgi:hypothetical protein
MPSYDETCKGMKGESEALLIVVALMDFNKQEMTAD